MVARRDFPTAPRCRQTFFLGSRGETGKHTDTAYHKREHADETGDCNQYTFHDTPLL